MKIACDLSTASSPSSCLTGQKTKLTNTGAKLQLKAEEFVTPRQDKFIFTVVAKSSVKPTRKEGTATQIVELSVEPVLQIFIKCVANCGELMNPSYRLILAAQCKVCHNMSYVWQLYSAVNNKVQKLHPADTLNEFREPVININKNVFASTVSETYELNLAGQSPSVNSYTLRYILFLTLCVCVTVQLTF